MHEADAFGKKVLDHGHLTMIATWGSEEGIVEAARMSTGKGFLGWGPFCSKCGLGMVLTPDGASPRDYERAEQKGCEHDADKAGDEKLLRYLYENRHDTPFEMAGATFEVQAPIFVFREWHRHRVPFGYNEMCLTGDKQAAAADGAEPLTSGRAFYSTANLRGWLGFLTLRMAPNAQWEIRQYANALHGMLTARFPRTLALFDERMAASRLAVQPGPRDEDAAATARRIVMGMDHDPDLVGTIEQALAAARGRK